MIIRTHSYPRVGLIGNPSDGYFGKTMAFAFSNFRATVDLYESPELEILPNQKDHSRFGSIDHLVDDVRRHGYYGGIRLLKATIKRFDDYCRQRDLPLHKRNFTIRYASNIPHGVGLAGSSAIITACLRALLKFYDVEVPPYDLATLALEAETEELHIPAGLQDRVVQAYGGLVYMDFDRELMARQGHGRYEPLDVALLPPMYVAYYRAGGEPTEVVHSDLRRRYNAGDKSVHSAIGYWARLTDRALRVLRAGRPGELGPLLDANFDRRRKVCPLNPEHVRLVEAARACGVSAKYTGSGGAIAGTYSDEKQFETLRRDLRAIGAVVIRPRFVRPGKVCP